MKAASYATSISTISVALLTSAFLAVDAFTDEIDRVHRVAELENITHAIEDAFVHRAAVQALSIRPRSRPTVATWFQCLDASDPPRPPRLQRGLTSDEVIGRLENAGETEPFCLQTLTNHVRLEYADSLVRVMAPYRTTFGEATATTLEIPASLIHDVREESDPASEDSDGAPSMRRQIDAEPANKLRRLAIELELSTPPESMTEKDFDQLVLRSKTKLAKASARVPFLDRDIRSSYALDALVVVTLALYALMRNRLRYVFRDRELGVGDPWLLVDAGVGLEKWLANAWLFCLVVIPWIVGATAIASGAGHAWIARQDASMFHHDGGGADVVSISFVSDLVSFLAIVGASWASSRLAIAIVAGLLQLRYRRRQLEVEGARARGPTSRLRPIPASARTRRWR